MKGLKKFSMIEVMVVLAVGATLISILFSTMKSGKDVAIKATCMSNISQIRNFAELYRKDHQNLPYSEVWLTDFRWVEPYTNKNSLAVFTCPGEEDALELMEISQLKYNTSYYYVPSVSLLEKNIADGLAYGVDYTMLPDIAASQNGVIYDKSPDHHNGSINIAYLFLSDDPNFDTDGERGTISSLYEGSDTTDELLAVLDDGSVEVPDLVDEVFEEEVAEEVAEEVDDTVEFTIDEGVVILEEHASAGYKILGAAISYGGQYDMPVTTKVRFQEPDGNVDIIQPFGSYGSVSAANVNGTSPQDFYAPKIYEPGTELTVIAKSWKKKKSKYNGKSDSHWKKYMEVDSNSSRNVKVLRDGDDVPQIAGFLNQGDIESFLGGYISNGKVTIEKNQAIFLYELGTTNLASASADFQDCVVLVTLFPEEGSGTSSSSKTKSNNGHGNNVDGVDSSNPGNAPFVDSDPSVDDEKK